MKLKQAEIGKVRRAMEKVLDAKRFEHTLGVAYTASCLAMCHDANIKNAEMAGLLHDCAKCLDNEKKISICNKHNIHINEIEYKNPFLLHAKVGSFLAMDRYGVRDKEIISAILNHTTGCPGMGLLEKIVYVADYIEPNRKQAPNLSEIRKLAFQDLDRALLRILEDTLSYLETIHSDIDPMTQKTYEYYREELTRRKMAAQ